MKTPAIEFELDDVARVTAFFCGAIPKSLVGERLRVVRVGYNGGIYVRHPRRKRAWYLGAQVIARCLVKERAG